MIWNFFQNLDKFWRFDGVTMLHAIVILPAMFVFPMWAIMGTVVGLGSPLSVPFVVDAVLRIILGVLLAFVGSYIFRIYNGFDTVRTGLVAKLIVGGIFVLLMLQIIGVINLIPG